MARDVLTEIMFFFFDPRYRSATVTG